MLIRGWFRKNRDDRCQAIENCKSERSLSSANGLPLKQSKLVPFSSPCGPLFLKTRNIVPRSQTMKNPFFALLIVVGSLFAVTAFAYGVMTLHAVRTVADAGHGQLQHPLLAWFKEYGNLALLVQLGILGALTFAAIGTDGYWDRQASLSESSHEQPGE
jgi:hypothetical protein